MINNDNDYSEGRDWSESAVGLCCPLVDEQLKPTLTLAEQLRVSPTRLINIPITEQ